MDNKKNSHLESDLIKKFLTVQEKEITIRAEELALRKQADENDFIYSKSALEANVQDRKETREHERKNIINKYKFAGIIISMLFLLIGYALSLNKDQIVFEALKAVLFFGSGALGGAGYMYSNLKKEDK